MNNKLNLMLLRNEKKYLIEQKNKFEDDTALFMTNNTTVDKGLIEAYRLDDVNIPVIDWIDKLISNTEKKIINCEIVEDSTKNVNDLPF